MEEKDQKTNVSKDKYFYGRGGRKNATAQARIFLKGKGEITVNNKKFAEYFPTKELQDTVLKPLVVTNHEKTVNVTLRAVGGGKVGQSQACSHAIARALEALNVDLRPALKAQGLMTRDPRVKERKKPGLKRARRAPQWSKR
jgi:small subunit ribosomal protein S9